MALREGEQGPPGAYPEHGYLELERPLRSKVAAAARVAAGVALAAGGAFWLWKRR